MRHAATVLLCSGLCHGGIITVPTEAQSIQEAIEASVNGDSIHVLPGMYNEAINLRGKAITLASTDGCAHTVIDAGGLGSSVQFVSGEGGKTVLRGFTITGGIGTLYDDGRYGGGLFLLNSSPRIEDCVISDNTADYGGGLHNLGSSPTIVSCEFRNNTASISGGGMRSHDFSEPIIDTCLFTNNIGHFGGAMDYATDSVPYITGSQLVGNGADIRGGAIFIGCDCSAPNIVNSEICLNVPDHIVGTWNDLGDNTVCDICEADITRDGVVDIAAVLDVIQAWGPGACIQDLTGEGGVDVNDLLIVIAAWGSCPL